MLGAHIAQLYRLCHGKRCGGAWVRVQACWESRKHVEPAKSCGGLQLEAHEEWEEEIDDIVAQFEAEYGRRPVYSICFY